MKNRTEIQLEREFIKAYENKMNNYKTKKILDLNSIFKTYK